MASSLTSPALVFSAERAIIAAHPAIAKARVFATDFSADAAQPGSTMKVPVFTPGTASQFDASTNNYATTDGSVVYASVTFANHPKHTFSFADTDFNLVNGRQFWARAGEASGIAVGRAIINAITALMGNIAQTTGEVLKVDSGTGDLLSGGEASKLWGREYAKGWEVA